MSRAASARSDELSALLAARRFRAAGGVGRTNGTTFKAVALVRRVFTTGDCALRAVRAALDVSTNPLGAVQRRPRHGVSASSSSVIRLFGAHEQNGTRGGLSCMFISPPLRRAASPAGFLRVRAVVSVFFVKVVAVRAPGAADGSQRHSGVRTQARSRENETRRTGRTTFRLRHRMPAHTPRFAARSSRQSAR